MTNRGTMLSASIIGSYLFHRWYDKSFKKLQTKNAVELDRRIAKIYIFSGYFWAPPCINNGHPWTICPWLQSADSVSNALRLHCNYNAWHGVMELTCTEAVPSGVVELTYTGAVPSGVMELTCTGGVPSGMMKLTCTGIVPSGVMEPICTREVEYIYTKKPNVKWRQNMKPQIKDRAFIWYGINALLGLMVKKLLMSEAGCLLKKYLPCLDLGSLRAATRSSWSRSSWSRS